MELFLNILSIIGIVLLVILALVLIILIIPIFYDVDLGTTNKSTYVNVKVKSILNIVIFEKIGDFKELKIFGFIKIKIKDHIKEYEEKVIELKEEDIVPSDMSFFRKLKLKAYITERKFKEKIYKFRKTVKEVNEYTYKMELLRKTIQFIEKVLSHVKPKESLVCVEMGCGSPDLTGKLIGMLSIMQARFPNLAIVPNFEKAMLELNVKANGRILPMKLLIIAIKFYNEDSVKELRALKRKEKYHA